MSNGKGVLTFETAPSRRHISTSLVLLGVVGMVINLIMLVNQFNSPILATVSGLLVVCGLLLWYRCPSQYELSQEGVTAFSWGHRQTLRWSEIDLGLSKSELRSRSGRRIPLLPVREGQNEFHAALLRGLSSQIAFESEWLRLNYQSDNQALVEFQRKVLLWGSVIVAYAFGLIVYLATQPFVSWMTAIGPSSQIFPLILTIWINRTQSRVNLPEKVFSTVHSEPAPVAMLTIKGVQSFISFRNLGDETPYKGSFLEGVIFSKALIGTAPHLSFQDDSQLLTLPESSVQQGQTVLQNS